MKKYRGILYDVDGTILNTLAMNMYPLMKIIKEETGKDLTFQEVLKYAPYPGMKVMEELGIKNKEETYARWVRYVNGYEKGATLYDEFEEVFESFQKAGILQGIVSAKTKEQYQIDMVEKGLDKYMKIAILADDTNNHKPHPEPLLLGVKKLGLKKEEVIYIGDSSSDLKAAKAAGIDFGYAKWGSVEKIAIEKTGHLFETPLALLRLIPNC